QNTPEGTAVEVLPPSAAAHAAAALVPRWLAGELPKAHLDATVPLDHAADGAAPKQTRGSTPG
ncbi:MAG: hypothetical protein K2X87_31070, partial [Gemmataceae bacterium]|nr:hypothetical protein [Gemmataceae bacterium]